MPTFRQDVKIGTKVPLLKTDDINDQAITKDKIRDGNVTTEKLADGAVLTGNLSDSSVTTQKIADGNVTTEKLSDASITTPKIADQNVTTDKIADQSVTSGKLALTSVTYDKIKDKAVITEKLNDRAVTTEKLEERAITNPKLGDQSVDGRVLREANVETKHLANESVTTEKIAHKSVTNDKIADGTVKIGNLDPELRKTVEAATGLPEDLQQMIQDVDESIKGLNETDANLQSQIDDKQAQITDNDADIATLQERSTQMEQSIKNIAASGGASVASAVTYDNEASGMTSVTAQGAIDELSSNKFDKENVAQELGDAEDKVVSQYALPFRIEESPEWAYLIKDAEDHVLFGIQQDGSVEWSVGIPAPIRKKFEEIVSSASDDKSELSAKIDELNTSLSAEIQSLQDTKVDKEEGKSLIDDEVKQHFEVIENDEWLTLMTDAEDHILFGIKRDTGKPYFPLNEMYHVEQSPEFFALWKDAKDHILMGIRRDGEIVGEIHAVNALKQTIADIQSDIETLKSKFSDTDTKVSTIDASLQELLNVFSLQENPEFLAVETDAEGKMLAYTKNDGSHYAYNMKSETIDSKQEKEAGKGLINSSFANAQTSFDDPEGRMEIITDADGRIMSYRDSVGKKHEHLLQVDYLEVKHLPMKTDLSDSGFIQIEQPRFAIVNISNTTSMPTTKKDNMNSFIEFWDMRGNYFKKHCIINAQGNSSLGFIKKNIALDFCDDEWIGDETPKIRFGNWVSQDSFHMKAYYTDFFRGVGAVSYKLYEQIVTTRGAMYDRPWKKALLDMSKIGVTAKSLGNSNVGDYSLLLDSGARCFPDGFPVACYLNGEFYGIFSWQLKKHRDNYHMEKSNADHVHLDGTLDWNTLWNGTISWQVGDNGFEVRNPKGLYAIGGNKYDADINQEEIAGEKEVNSWISAGKLPDGTLITSKIKKSLQMTAKVKKHIQDFANSILTISAAASTYESSSKTNGDLETFKKVFETYYDKDNLIDYIIVSDLIKNADGFRKNWQWFTYDGTRWYVGLYDCDMSFGGHWQGNQIEDVLTDHLNSSTLAPNGYIIKYYQDELNERYKELADKGIASSENIFGLLKDWTLRIGSDYYNEEYKVWSDSPCFGNSVVRTDYWELMLDGDGKPQVETEETFDATTKYNVGDEVSFGLNVNMGFYKFKCVRETTALSKNIPHEVTRFSPISEFKYCDTLYRAEKWIEQNTENLAKVYRYTRK